MEDNYYLELPELIELCQYNGNFNAYLEAIYALFKRDFIDNRPKYRGVRLGLKKYPLSQERKLLFGT
jgi:hypothetical protein